MEKTVALLVLGLIVCTPALGESGTALLQACEALEREARISGDRITVPARGDIQRCWGYMSAVQDFSIIVTDEKRGIPLLNSFPGPETTLIQLIRVFTEYARRHPQNLHNKASLIVYEAMLAAFPCP
jgi:hypothetical protein